MPRNQGTSRKGKPKASDRAAGMGNALQRATNHRYRPKTNGKSRGGGMAMQPGVQSIGLVQDADSYNKTRSVLEMNDLQDFLLQADLANREFETERNGMVVLDATGRAYQPSGSNTNAASNNANKTEFVFCELSVPRRPSWDETTSAIELQRNEQEAFLNWRRAIAVKEEELMRVSSSTHVTPYEKNLEVWRQLWRVLERSSCLLQLVDARNPLFYLSDDLKEYAASLGKPMMVLINKSDYLSQSQRQLWKEYLNQRGWDPVFFSAFIEQKKLDDAAQRQRRKDRQAALQRDAHSDNDDDGDDDDSSSESSNQDNSDDDDDDDDDSHVSEAETQEESKDGRGVDVPLSRRQLIETMLAFARQHDCQPDERFYNRIQFGMVGFPNVGKSSVINVLVGSSKHAHGVVRVAVASQPGKTKHFQTLLLPDSDEIMLCDCPGLVFPSFVSNTADLIAAAVFPISQMRDYWPVINLICERIPREIINAHYGIQLPIPTEQDLRERGLSEVPPPSPEEFLTAFCIARSMLAASSGVPDFQRAARIVIKDYAEGKLLYCHAPPHIEDKKAFYRETVATALLNTKKLKERLIRQHAKNAKKTASALEDSKREQQERKAKSDADFVDDDLLELVGSTTAEQLKIAEGGPSKKSKAKWGKKNRKNRNKDPYGCHATPDELLAADVTSGVYVNAGKYGRKGYTRPSYGSITGLQAQSLNNN